MRIEKRISLLAVVVAGLAVLAVLAAACSDSPEADAPAEATPTTERTLGTAATTAEGASASAEAAQPRPRGACAGELASAGGTAPLLVEAEGRPIEALIHLPTGYDDREPHPLLLLFHGGGSNPAAILFSSQLAETADAHGFILVAPPNGSSVSIEVVLDHVEATWCVDSARVYASGLSAGARIASRLGCDLPGRLAAVAPMAGVQFPAIPCDGEPPLPVIAFHGAADGVLVIESAEAGIEGWTRHDGCSALVSEQLGELVRVDRYTPCEGGVEVTFVVIEGGGHVWFGSPSTGAPDPLPEGTNELLWAFLARFALGDAAQ